VLRSAVLGALAVGASAAAATLGRSAPVIVRHATVAQQFENAPGTLVTMRAVAEFPTRRRFSVSAAIDGAFDERGAPAEPSEQRFDTGGRPLLDGDAVLGGARSFRLDGVTGFRALDVSRRGGVLRVSNVSSRPLTCCEWPAGLRAPGAGTLQPGASFEAAGAIQGTDPVVSCRFQGAPVDFSEAHARVQPDGVTTVVYHFATPGANDDSR